MFFFRQKQLDSLPSITGGSDFVSALNSEKRNINSKKAILKHKSQNYQCEWHLAVSLQNLTEKGGLGIHYLFQNMIVTLNL